MKVDIIIFIDVVGADVGTVAVTLAFCFVIATV